MLVKQAYVCYPPGYAWPFDYHMGRLFFWNKIKFRPLLSWAHHLLAEEEKRCRVKHRKPSDISETRFPPPFALCFNSVCTHICHLSHHLAPPDRDCQGWGGVAFRRSPAWVPLDGSLRVCPPVRVDSFLSGPVWNRSEAV